MTIQRKDDMMILLSYASKIDSLGEIKTFLKKRLTKIKKEVQITCY